MSNRENTHVVCLLQFFSITIFKNLSNVFFFIVVKYLPEHFLENWLPYTFEIYSAIFFQVALEQ